jgi:hypothetical protein
MEEKKIAYAYTVTVYENEDVEVNPLEVEGGRTLTNPEIMDDICKVADKIEITKIKNAAYQGTLEAFRMINTVAETAEVEK